MPRVRTLAPAMVGATLAFALPTHAQTPEDWRFQAALNVYLPDIGGSTTFPQGGAGSDVTLDAGTILENLKMTFMGSFEASRGRWGVFSDVLYMDIGHTRSNFHELSIGGLPLPAGATAKADYDMKGWVWTLGGVWHLSSDAASRVDLIVGARLLDIEQTLDWELTGNVGSIALPGRAGSAQVTLSNWDAIVGVKGRMAFGEGRKWFAPYYADIGSGDSDLTWQAMGGIGYAFQWGELVGAWRYVDYDMKAGNNVQSLTFSGPMVSVVFRW